MSDRELQAAMSAIAARHGLAGVAGFTHDPVWLLAWMREHPGTSAVRADDVLDGLTLTSWLWHQRGSFELMLLEWGAELKIPRRDIGRILRIDTSQGVADRLAALRTTHLTEAPSPADLAAQQRRDTEVDARREAWVKARSATWAELAERLLKHKKRASDNEASEVYSDLLELEDTAARGHWTRGRVRLLADAASGLAGEAASAGTDPGHALFVVCADVARAVAPLQSADPGS